MAKVLTGRQAPAPCLVHGEAVEPVFGDRPGEGAQCRGGDARPLNPHGCSLAQRRLRCLGGGRRDEEKARAKERIFSHRDGFGQWSPKEQRPELWTLFNTRHRPGEHFRAFPISNWTEMDVWQYIKKENIALPSIYFAHDRNIVNRGGVLLAESPYNTLLPGEKYEQMHIRYRTLGCMTITGAIFSDADDLDKVIEEVAAARSTERGNRADDKRSEAAIEDRKKQGYF